MQASRDYRLLDNWGMSKELAMKLTSLGTIAWFVFSWLFGSLYLWFTGRSPDITGNGLLSVISVIVLILVTGIIHELLHGLLIKKFGARPVYGAGLAYYILPYFYVTTKERFLFTRRQFITILLAPFVCVSTVGIILMLILPAVSSWLLFPLTFNAAGSIADIWMTRTLLRYPKHVMIADDKSGMMVYGTAEDRSLDISPSGFVRVFAKSALNFFFAITALVIFLPIFLAALKISSLTIGPRGSIFTIFDYSISDSGGSFSLGSGALLSSIMLSACAGLIRTVLKAGDTDKKK